MTARLYHKRWFQPITRILGYGSLALVIALAVYITFVAVFYSTTMDSQALSDALKSLRLWDFARILLVCLLFLLSSILLNVFVFYGRYLFPYHKTVDRFARVLSALPVVLLATPILACCHVILGPGSANVFVLAIALAVAAMPTGLVIVSEVADEYLESAKAAGNLGLRRDYTFWTIVLPENVKQLRVAVLVGGSRAIAEITVFTKLAAMPGNILSFEALNEISKAVAQSTYIKDNILLIVLVIFLSLISRIALALAALFR